MMGDVHFDGQKRDGGMGVGTWLTPEAARVAFPPTASQNRNPTEPFP